MEFIPESKKLADYLDESDEVNYSHPFIQEKVDELFTSEQTDLEMAKLAFEYVRDEISHSWDIQSSKVTCRADEVLTYNEGICYAKSNLLAALLRAKRIPTGFCYQRLLLFDAPEEGYCIHALNAVFLTSIGRWIRLDARGNKPGVQAEFSIEEEKLAFPVNEQQGEIDYPIIYTKPHKKIIDTLKQHTNAIEMYTKYLPSYI
ncbi:transglutaminase family protein [Ectobacillus sp. sgz5001026]|uniref:transglutaminase-like domain-containing protein n=1 Tax=Ectobacillus sp. sgz5001026 TaxID=3242473 RepID=UPI0036D2A607